MKYKDAHIIIDNDESITYETNRGWERPFNTIFIPFLNSLPSRTGFLIKRTHRSAADVIENKTSHVALEILYQNGEIEKIRRKKLMEKIFHRVWFGRNNAKAVRNRLKIVEREIFSAVSRLSQRKESVYVLSIAAGSARAVLNAFKRLEEDGGSVIVHATFLDKNPAAIEYSKRMVEEMDFGDRFVFRWIVDTANSFAQYFSENSPDVVEMVGLLDYFDDERAKKIFQTVFENMSNGGVFITANICENSERPFVENVVGWRMVYRDAESLVDIAHSVGMATGKISVYYEPLEIHAILVFLKS